MNNPLPDLEVLKYYFTLNSDGELFWKRSKGTVKAGQPVGYISSDGYRRCTFNGENFLNHRVVYYLETGIDPGDMDIDHIDRNRMNNRIDNLRLVNQQQNKSNTEGKGYCFRKKSNKWSSQICVNYKDIHLGLFDTRELARDAYVQAKRHYCGEYSPV